MTKGTRPPAARRSVEGRTLRYAVFGDEGETVLLLATIHGDETAGTPLLEELCTRLAQGVIPAPERRVVVVPLANPDGHARNSRANANGVDLNRNFPAHNWRKSRAHGPHPLSEPESMFLFDLLAAYTPVHVLSFHQAADLIDYDGPGEALARRLAAVSPLKVKRLGSRPGSLGSYTGLDLGRPIITVELPRSADRLDGAALWKLYGALVMEAIRADSLPAEDAEREGEGEHAP